VAHPQKTQQVKKTWYWLQLTASLIGMLISLYLLVQHTRLKSGIQGGASFCSFGAHFNCDVVNVSDYAEVFGIPLAAFGALYFFVLVMLGLMATPSDKKFGRLQWLMGVLNVTALAVDLALLVIQVVKLKNFCLMCFLTYAATGVALWGNLMLTGGDGTFGSRFRRALSLDRFTGGGRFSTPALIMASLGVVCYVALLMMIPSFVRSSSPTEAHVEDALFQYFEAWKKMPIKSLEVKPEDGVFGNPMSRVRVLVFSDFQCPFCKKGAFTLSTALTPMKDKVLLVFKHFPLDSKCNPLLQYQLHAHACDLAKLGFCARKKGKFWDFHDRVFFNMTEGDLEKGNDAIAAQLKDILTKEEFDRCLADDAPLKSIAEDIKLGNSLGVKGTPSVFINGKPVTIPLTVENLQKLVSIEEGSSS
jgi:protein-disulfide isomerase/uncharacterized membrane protein